MRKIFKFALLCAFSSVIFCYSCKKSSSSSPSSTSSDPRDAIAGSWIVTDNISYTIAGNTTHTYVLNVSKGSASDAIVLTNFEGEKGVVINAILNGSSFTIPSQTVKDGTNAQVTGSGTFSGNTVTYTYNLAESDEWGGNATSRSTGTKK